MNRFISIMRLALVAVFFSSPGSAVDKWSPFADDSQQIVLTPVICAEGAVEYRHLQRFNYVNADEDVRFVFVPGAEKWRLSLKINGTQYMSHVYSDQNLSMGVNGVYARDLNGDGLTDFIVDLVNGGFCGLGAGQDQILVILPRKDATPVIHNFWTYDFGVEDVVDMDKDGRAEIIVSELIQQTPKYQWQRCYWVYDRYEFDGMDMVPLRTEDWPFWIFDPDISADFVEESTTHFTRAEKDAMWAEHLKDRETVKTAALTDQRVY